MNKKTNPIQSSIWIVEQAILLLIALATIGATIIELVRIFDVMTVNLSDLFLLFIYAEVLGMVGVFYRDNRVFLKIIMNSLILKSKVLLFLKIII